MLISSVQTARMKPHVKGTIAEIRFCLSGYSGLAGCKKCSRLSQFFVERYHDKIG